MEADATKVNAPDAAYTVLLFHPKRARRSGTLYHDRHPVGESPSRRKNRGIYEARRKMILNNDNDDRRRWLENCRPKRSQTRPTFHYLQKGSGRWLTAGWETANPSPTEYSTHSFGESPSAGAESRLSQILEDTPHPKCFLSAKACAGILRRGKKLLPEMEAALIQQSQGASPQDMMEARV